MLLEMFFIHHMNPVNARNGFVTMSDNTRITPYCPGYWYYKCDINYNNVQVLSLSDTYKTAKIYFATSTAAGIIRTYFLPCKL